MTVGRHRPASCPPSVRLLRGAHLQHGTGQRTASGGRGWISAADGTYGGYLCSFPWRYLPWTVVRGPRGGGEAEPRFAGRWRFHSPRSTEARRAAAVILGSPRGGSYRRRLEAVVGSPRGGCQRLASLRWPASASRVGFLLFGGWLWVLQDDRNGSFRGEFRQSGPEATATRIARAQPKSSAKLGTRD